MPFYMVQNMSNRRSSSTYYRAQSTNHVSHSESEKFTKDAKRVYARSQHIQESDVELGSYKSGQGKPQSGKEI